jgi:hypothetical protein
MLAKTLVMMITSWIALVGAEIVSDPFTGTWKVNPHSCNLGAMKSDPKRNLLKIEVSGDEYRMTYRDGRKLVLRLDGVVHKPEAGGFSSMVGADESIARRIDERTVDLTEKRTGKVVGKIRREVSANGRALTFTVEGTSMAGEDLSGVCVYDRLQATQWSPDGKWFWVNDRWASDRTNSYIYDAQTLEPIDIEKQIQAADAEARRLEDAHRYFEVKRWADNRSVVVEFHGHTDSPPPTVCFQLWYRVTVSGAVKKISQRVFPVTDPGCRE